VVAVAQDHSLQQVEMLLVDSLQAVLIDHQHTQLVAGIEQFGGGRIV
jgi:hypothetical protein